MKLSEDDKTTLLNLVEDYGEGKAEDNLDKSDQAYREIVDFLTREFVENVP